MTIKFTGDFAELDRFAKKLDSAGQAEHLRILNTQLAEEAIDLINEGFERSEDPYGKRWEPLVFRAGQPLRDKGGLKSSWHYAGVSPDGFTVRSGKNYAVYHQGGTGIYGPRKARIKPVRAKALHIPQVGFFASVAGTPKRLMVPNTKRLPRKWRTRFISAATDVLTALFEGP